MVRILDELAGPDRLRRGQRDLEIRQCRSLAAVQVGLDLMNEHGARPAVLHGPRGYTTLAVQRPGPCRDHAVMNRVFVQSLLHDSLSGYFPQTFACTSEFRAEKPSDRETPG